MNIGTRIVIVCIFCLSAMLLFILAAWEMPVMQVINESLFEADLPDLGIFPATLRYFSIAFSALSLGSGLVLYILFRKTTSPEILFFVISILTIGFISLRGVAEAVRSLSVSNFWYVLLYKAYLFFYLFSLMQYFLGGMFSNGIPFLKKNLFLSISFFLSFTLVSILPLGHTSVPVSGFSALTYSGYILILARIIEISSVINYVAASVRNQNSQYLLLALALTSIFVGLELFMGTASFLPMLIGIILYALSAFFFAHRIYLIRLWN